MNEIEKLKNELAFKLQFKIIEGRWLINGKTYAECGFVEKHYFDLYIYFKRRAEKTKNK